MVEARKREDDSKDPRSVRDVVQPELLTAREREDDYARPVGDAVHQVVHDVHGRKKRFELAEIGYAEGSWEVKL